MILTKEDVKKLIPILQSFEKGDINKIRKFKSKYDIKNKTYDILYIDEETKEVIPI